MAAEFYCRERFVVDSYEVIGFDEDFPSGYTGPGAGTLP